MPITIFCSAGAIYCQKDACGMHFRFVRGVVIRASQTVERACERAQIGAYCSRACYRGRAHCGYRRKAGAGADHSTYRGAGKRAAAGVFSARRRVMVAADWKRRVLSRRIQRKRTDVVAPDTAFEQDLDCVIGPGLGGKISRDDGGHGQLLRRRGARVNAPSMVWSRRIHVWRKPR
jgi:hypothetical protein